MSFFVAGLGTAVPRHSILQADAAAISSTFHCTTPEQKRLLEVMYRRAAVERRGSVLLEASDGPLAERQHFFPAAANPDDRGPGTAQRLDRYEAEASRLAFSAAWGAVAEAGIAPQKISHLVTVSCTGFGAPGFDIALIRELKLNPTVARTHVGFMGCHGALNGLRVARALTTADPDACVLLCAVELCTVHTQYGWEPEQVVADSLFADGAAAIVGTGRPIPQPMGRGDAPWELRDSAGAVFPDSEDAMTWRIGDHGFRMTLSPRVPDLIATHVRPWLDEWLGRWGLDVAAVGSWAVHPGGPRIVSAFGEAVGLSRAALGPSLDVLRQHGNMSSPTVLFALGRLRRKVAPRPCVAIGFGPGLAVEAALFT